MTDELGSYEVGMRVANKGAADWGPGKILAISGLTATVYFRDIQEMKVGDALKRMDLASGLLEILPAQSDPLLDNLPPLVNGEFQITKPRLTLAQALSLFLQQLPNGFNDPAYLGNMETGERNYKWAAHELWAATLGAGQGRRLLEQGNVGEVTARALAVDGKLNLLSVFEKAALRDGLKDTAAAERYFLALFELLEAGRPSRQIFDKYIEALTSLPAAEGKAPVTRWPVLTLFPFIASPDRFMFLKPEVTKDCADRLAFNLQYTPTLNWTTYDRLLTMCEVLMVHLRALGARDLIDVQSFIWLVANFE